MKEGVGSKGVGVKAQALSTESIFAYMIFLIVFTSIVFLWNSTTAKIAIADHNIEVQDLAMIITENLIRTGGSPENWTEYNYLSADPGDIGVEVIGLAGTSRVLDQDKVIAFIDMMNSSNNNYSSHKWLLGLSKPRFSLEFYFKITDINGTTLNVGGRECVTGKQSPSTAIYMFPVTRTAILNEEIVKVAVVVWNPEN